MAVVRHASRSARNTPCSRHHAFLPTSSIAAVVITASRRASAIQPRVGMTLAWISSRQRANVPAPMPTSYATTSSAPLSGGSNRAIAFSLNRFPYRATFVLLCRLKGDCKEATTRLTWRVPHSDVFVMARRGRGRRIPATMWASTAIDARCHPLTCKCESLSSEHHRPRGVRHVEFRPAFVRRHASH